MSRYKAINPDVRDHYVYRAYNAAGELLYIGCTKRPVLRFKEHRSDYKDWVDEVVRVRMQGPYNYQTAREIEREAISTENPLHNETPVRASAKRRRHNWESRRTAELIAEKCLDPTSVDDHFAMWEIAHEEALRIDWTAIAEAALAKRAAA